MNNCFLRILFWLDIFYCAPVSLLHESCLNVCKCVCLKTIFLSFKYLFSWLPVSKYVCMHICLKVCWQTCLKTFFRVYKKTLTHVRLTINFIPSDKIYLYFVFPFGLHYCFQYSTALYPSSIPIFLLLGNSSRIILFSLILSLLVLSDLFSIETNLILSL